MGRSPIPILLTKDGIPLFGDPYEFKYGKADLVREGKDAAIITTGGMVYRAVQACEKIERKRSGSPSFKYFLSERLGY